MYSNLSPSRLGSPGFNYVGNVSYGNTLEVKWRLRSSIVIEKTNLTLFDWMKQEKFENVFVATLLCMSRVKHLASDLTVTKSFLFTVVSCLNE
jgi:hypothetical protein